MYYNNNDKTQWFVTQNYVKFALLFTITLPSYKITHLYRHILHFHSGQQTWILQVPLVVWAFQISWRSSSLRTEQMVNPKVIETCILTHRFMPTRLLLHQGRCDTKKFFLLLRSCQYVHLVFSDFFLLTFGVDAFFLLIYPIPRKQTPWKVPTIPKMHQNIFNVLGLMNLNPKVIRTCISILNP